MNSLANMVNGKDVFETTTVNETQLVTEYFERNERKKEDEKWLKSNKAKIEAVLARHDKSKMDFGDVRVSVVVPDASKFDLEKVADYVMSMHPDSRALREKIVVDEEALAQEIEQGLIDLEALREAAWVEATGTPRLTVGKARKGE